VLESIDKLAVEVFGERLEVATRYAELLTCEGIEWGLLGPRETDRIWDRHLLNSVCISPYVNRDSLVADIGSGAGLPGIPLAIARPDLQVVLVEPMERRVKFLDLCIRDLGLQDSVQVVRCRGEEYRPKAGVDVVTCRALSSVEKLVGMVEPLLNRAEVLAIKGDRASLEVEEAQDYLAKKSLTAEVIRSEVGGSLLGTVLRITKA
jgi:16S rRNA (guanine527-N7)-methyltransferase